MPEYTFTVNGKTYTAKSAKKLSDAELSQLISSMSSGGGASAFAGAKAGGNVGVAKAASPGKPESPMDVARRAGRLSGDRESGSMPAGMNAQQQHEWMDKWQKSQMSDKDFVKMVQSGKWIPASAYSREAHARRGTRPPATVEDTKRESEAFTEPIKNFAIEALGQIQPLSRLGPGRKGIGGQVGTVLGSLVADPIDALIFDSQIASNPNATFWEKAGAYANLGTKVALPGSASAADELLRPIIGAIGKTRPVSKGLEWLASSLGHRKPPAAAASAVAPSGAPSVAFDAEPHVDPLGVQWRKPLPGTEPGVQWRQPLPGVEPSVTWRTPVEKALAPETPPQIVDDIVDAFEAELPNLTKRKREMFVEIAGEIGDDLRHAIHKMASNPQKLKQIVDEFKKGKDKASKEITQLANRLLMERHTPEVVPDLAEQLKASLVDAGVSPTRVTYTLPKELSKASPNYTAPGTKGSRKIVFASDYDRAAYILANDAKRGGSKSASKIKASLEEAGADIADVIKDGKAIVEEVKAAAAKQRGVGPIKLGGKTATTSKAAKITLQDALTHEDPKALLEQLRADRAARGGRMPKGKGKGRSGTVFIPGTDDWEAALAHGVVAIRAGAASIKSFTDELVAEFGEAIRIHAESLWLQAKGAAHRPGGSVNTGPNVVNARGEIQQAPLFDMFGEPVPAVHPGAPLPMHQAAGGASATPMSTNMYAQPDMFGGPPSVPKGFHLPNPGDDPLTTALRENGPAQRFPEFNSQESRLNPSGRNIFTGDVNQSAIESGPATWGKDIRGINRATRLADLANRINDFKVNVKNMKAEALIRASGMHNALDMAMNALSPSWRQGGRVTSYLNPKEVLQAVWGEGNPARRWADEMTEAMRNGNVSKLDQLGFQATEAPGFFKYVGRATGISDIIFEDVWYNLTRAELKKLNPNMDDVFLDELARAEAKSQVFLNTEDFTGGSFKGGKFSPGGSTLDDALRGIEMRLDSNTGQIVGLIGDQIVPFPKILARVVGRKTDYAFGALKAAARYGIAKKMGGLTIQDKRTILSLASRNMYGLATAFIAKKVYESDPVERRKARFLQWLGMAPNTDGPIQSYDRSSGSIIMDDREQSPNEAVYDSMYTWLYLTDEKMPLSDSERERAVNKLTIGYFDSPVVSGPRRFSSSLDRGLGSALGELGAKSLTSFLPPPIRDIQTGTTAARLTERKPEIPATRRDGFLDQMAHDIPMQRDRLEETGAAHPELAKNGIGFNLYRKFKESDQELRKRDDKTRSEIRKGIDSDLADKSFKVRYDSMSPAEKMVSLEVLQNLHKFRYEQTQDMDASFNPGVSSQDADVLDKTLKALDRTREALSLRMHKHELDALDKAIKSAEEKLYGKPRKPGS